MVQQAKDLLPKISSNLAAHQYYASRLELARTQAQMEEEFGRSFFKQTLESVQGHKSQTILSQVRGATIYFCVEAPSVSIRSRLFLTDLAHALPRTHAFALALALALARSHARSHARLHARSRIAEGRSLSQHRATKELNYRLMWQSWPLRWMRPRLFNSRSPGPSHGFI